MQYMHFRDNSSLYGYFELVYHRIEITVSHVTHLIFRFRVHATYTNVRKVEVYEYKLVLNCGQFYNTFFTLTQQKKLLISDENHWLGINPQIPSLDPPL